MDPFKECELYFYEGDEMFSGDVFLGDKYLDDITNHYNKVKNKRLYSEATKKKIRKYIRTSDVKILQSLHKTFGKKAVEDMLECVITFND